MTKDSLEKHLYFIIAKAAVRVKKSLIPFSILLTLLKH